MQSPLLHLVGGSRELDKLVVDFHVDYLYFIICGWSDVVYMTTLHVFSFTLSCLVSNSAVIPAGVGRSSSGRLLLKIVWS